MKCEEFEYTAKIQLPKTDINKPKTWFIEIYQLEEWLNQHIGIHMHDWAYVSTKDNLTIGFKKPEHKTFFLLYYTK